MAITAADQQIFDLMGQWKHEDPWFDEAMEAIAIYERLTKPKVRTATKRCRNGVETFTWDDADAPLTDEERAVMERPHFGTTSTTSDTLKMLR